MDRSERNKITVPPGFRELLGALCREILRHQPKNCIEFAAQYFEQKVIERDGTSRPVLQKLSVVEMIRSALDSGEITTEVEILAATKIQAIYRGHRQKKLYKQLLIEKAAALPSGVAYEDLLEH